MFDLVESVVKRCQAVPALEVNMQPTVDLVIRASGVHQAAVKEKTIPWGDNQLNHVTPVILVFKEVLVARLLDVQIQGLEKHTVRCTAPAQVFLASLTLNLNPEAFSARPSRLDPCEALDWPRPPRRAEEFASRHLPRYRLSHESL